MFLKAETVKLESILEVEKWTNPQGEVKYFNSITAEIRKK